MTNQKILEMIQAAPRILLLTDERIDGDTTGSTLAMFHYLKGIGKEVSVFSPQPWPEAYAFLPGSEIVRRDSEIFGESWDLMMIFDCADGKYLSQFPLSTFQSPPLVVFDHHATNPRYGTVNNILVEASSTGEVVWKFFKANRITISKEMATCLLTAICTDTTLFSNPSTTKVCMEAASELGLTGAKMQDIVRAFYMNRSVQALRLWGLALERVRELPGRVIVTALKLTDLEETSATEDDIQGISNFLIAMVADAQIVCVLHEKADGSVKAGLRTLEGDVAVIAQKMGGGGHIKAAGFSILNSHLAEGADGWRIVKADGTYHPVAEILKI